MIAGLFHEGSGLGNQLHRYVATRVLAQDKGYAFGMYDPDLFKGDSFMQIDKGTNPALGSSGDLWVWNEKRVNDENGVDIRSYDPEINFVKDHTLIDGEFQDERYFKHRLSDIRTWLAVEPLFVPDDLCIIGFRGGEFSLFSDLFLPKAYWDAGMALMRQINPDMRFEVHTDDPQTAKLFFPELDCIHDIGINWRSTRYVTHSIVANSSFYILPRLIQHFDNKKAVTVAPRYWARHNTRTWALPQNYYSDFTYLHAEDPD